MSTVPVAKKCVVVGGTSGIGHGCALALAARGFDVTIAGRSAIAGATIVDELVQVGPSGTHKFVKVDCFNLKDVKRLADDLKSSREPLDYLVMSQGMATIQGYTSTVSGLDQKLSLHYYSRVLLASLLSNKLSESSDPRVMSVLSGGIHGPYKNYKEDVGLLKNYSNMNAANAAGFYNDLAFDVQSGLYPKTSWIHSAPGFVNTNWGTEMPFWIRGPVRFLQPLFGKTKEKCGEELVNGMLLNATKGFNVMDQNGNVGGTRTKLHLESAKETVWKHSVKVFEDLGLM